MSDRDPPVRRLFRIGDGGPGSVEAVDWEIQRYLAERTDGLVEEGWPPEEEADRVRRVSLTRRVGGDGEPWTQRTLSAPVKPARCSGWKFHTVKG